jgi:hypothetical protein
LQFAVLCVKRKGGNIRQARYLKSDKNRNQDLPSSTIVIVAVAVNSALIVGEIVRTNQYENNKLDWKLKEDIKLTPQVGIGTLCPMTQIALTQL